MSFTEAPARAAATAAFAPLPPPNVCNPPPTTVSPGPGNVGATTTRSTLTAPTTTTTGFTTPDASSSRWRLVRDARQPDGQVRVRQLASAREPGSAVSGDDDPERAVAAVPRSVPARRVTRVRHRRVARSLLRRGQPAESVARGVDIACRRCRAHLHPAAGDVRLADSVAQPGDPRQPGRDCRPGVERSGGARSGYRPDDRPVVRDGRPAELDDW